MVDGSTSWVLKTWLWLGARGGAGASRPGGFGQAAVDSREELARTEDLMWSVPRAEQPPVPSGGMARPASNPPHPVAGLSFHRAGRRRLGGHRPACDPVAMMWQRGLQPRPSSSALASPTGRLRGWLLRLSVELQPTSQ